MTLEIVIMEKTIGEDTVKVACTKIDGTCCGEAYTYPLETENSVIESEVEADLTAKGFTWE